MCFSLQQLLFLLCLSYLVSAQEEICGAEAYDLGPLIREGYWEVEVNADRCKEMTFPGACKLYMAFCQELPSNITGCDTNNSGMGPTSLCITNGTVGFSLGEYDPNVNPFGNSTTRLEANFDAESEYPSCPSQHYIRTTMFFNCNPTAEWDFDADNDEYGNATSFLYRFDIDPLDPCIFTMEFHYDKVCPPAVCGTDTHNIEDLTSADYWQADVDTKQCREFFGTEEKCTLYLNFCSNLKGVTGCDNSTVCLTSSGGQTFKFGSYNLYVNPFTVSEAKDLLVTYHRGEHYPGCPNTYTDDVSTLLTLKCNEGNNWEHSGKSGDATSHLLVVKPSPLDGCDILITMNYSGACVVYPIRPPGSSNNTHVGWVGFGLLIGLLVIVTLYLTIGSVVNISQGTSGCPEMLPQFAFWKAFFMYVIDGFYFTADLITCGLCTRTVGAPPSSNYDKL